MSVVACPQCREKVSSERAACPRCGAPLTQSPASAAPARVVVTGVDVPVGDLMWLILKWTVAAIPAALAWAVVLYFLAALIGRVTGRT